MCRPAAMDKGWYLVSFLISIEFLIYERFFIIFCQIEIKKMRSSSWKHRCTKKILIFCIFLNAQEHVPKSITNSRPSWLDSSQYWILNKICLKISKVWGKKPGHTQKLAINKKSTIFVLSSWNSVKIITSWGNYFHQVL